MHNNITNCSSCGKSPQELISENLKHLRLQHGLSQEEVGEAVSISRTKYNKIEKGRMCPDVITLCDLLAFYDISFETLLNPTCDCMPVHCSEQKVNHAD